MFWREKLQGSPLLKVLSKKLSEETLRNCFQIFPPKVLVYGYRGQIFYHTYVINLIEFNKLIKEYLSHDLSLFNLSYLRSIKEMKKKKV